MPTPTALLKKLDDLREKEDFAAIVKLICAEIAKAKDGKPIEALEGAEAVEEMFLGEDDAGPDVASALLKRAFEVGGAGGASLLRMLNVISLYDHAEPLMVVPPKTSYRKKEVLSAIEPSLTTLRSGITDKNAAFRAASLYLLLTCSNTKAEDAEAVSQCLTNEKDSTVRLTAILALGVIGKRLPTSDAMRVACVKAIEAEAKKKYPAKDAMLATACVANASAMLGIAWSKKLVAEVKASLKKPALLPNVWGYHEGSNTMQVVMGALAAQPSAVLEPLVDGIAKMGTDAIELLYPLAFGSMETPVCNGIGIVLDELNPLQRRVLEAFAGPEFKNSYALRDQLGMFGMSFLKEVMDAKLPLWKPIPVKTKTGTRELAPAIIWRMTSRGMIDVAEAMKAFTKSLSAADLGDIVLYGSDAIAPINVSRQPEDRARNTELLVEAVTWVEKNDAAWPKRVRESVTSDKRKIDFCIGYTLMRLVAQKKLQLEEGDKDYVQMFVLSAMGTALGFVEYVPFVPPNIRDYMIQDAVPSNLKEIKKFLTDHPYKAPK